MRIGIDLDGTVADNLELLVETMNRYSGKTICGEDIRQYSLCKTYNITPAEFFTLMEQEEPIIIQKSPEIPGARENLVRLVEEGWELHFITARNPNYRQITENWLREKQIPYHQLHLLNSHDKLEVCRELNVQCMVEDNINNAYQLSEGGVEVILFEAPHNRHWDWKGIRCETWDDIYASIKNLGVK